MGREHSKKQESGTYSSLSSASYSAINIDDAQDICDGSDDDRPKPVGNITPTKRNVLSFTFLSLATASTVISFIPVVIISQSLYELTHRNYFSLPLAIFFFIRVFFTYLLLRTTDNYTQLAVSCWPSEKKDDAYSRRIFPLVMLLAEFSVLLNGLIIPHLFAGFRKNFFVEADHTIAIEWRDLERSFFYANLWSILAALLDLGVVVCGISLLWEGETAANTASPLPLWFCKSGFYRRMSHGFSISEYYFRLAEFGWRDVYRRIAILSLCGALPTLLSASISAYIYLPNRDPPPDSHVGPHCDPIDETECLFPFPSSFFTRQDDTTVTGRRVDIHRDALSTMYKHGGPVHPSFLNHLDGFSTGGPIVFYLKGMKQGKGKGSRGGKLPGPDDIEISITSGSVTLLLDVDSSQLVPHWADFDLIDRRRPSIVMQPAAPLKHNTTYAVAVINALGSSGKILPRSEGLAALLTQKTENDEQQNRANYYQDVVLPTFQSAASWIESVLDIQLLFDFHTASAESQLGTARTVRDKTLGQIQHFSWNWTKRINVVRTEKGRCRRSTHSDHTISRTIHVEVEVPWYLTIDSPRHRASYIDQEAVESEQVPLEAVKLVILVPCSLVNRGANSTNLTAIVDFGHSFLYSRQEVIDSTFLHKMANANGYILVASNWRGMSRLDLPVVLRTFVAEPNLFQAARDNLIQCYAAKMAIQHFCRHSLLDMDFMKFPSRSSIQIEPNQDVRFFFWGISQGGILGGGYSALTGGSGMELLDGAILGNPGTPFSLLMARSDIFPLYLKLLLLNLYHRRHARIVVVLMQMAWDTVEVSGVLAPPLTEPLPKTLIQTGLGDSTVTTLGAEVMARAYRAKMFPNGPRQPFGLETIHDDDTASDSEAALFTELLYEKDLLQITWRNSSMTGKLISKSNTDAIIHNDVHWCTRLDPALQEQIRQFIVNNTFIDACATDGCYRSNATC